MRRRDPLDHGGGSAVLHGKIEPGKGFYRNEAEREDRANILNGNLRRSVPSLGAGGQSCQT